jgi:uncharacterized protein Usg
MASEDFRRRVVDGGLAGSRQLVTVSVLYYLPDYPSLLNEFLWQTMDLGPKYPRVEAFLDHWRREIDATIKEVMISGSRSTAARTLRTVDDLVVLH